MLLATIQRLNVDGRGDLIGEFRGEDRILIITQSGTVKTIVPEITSHFEDDMIVLEKWIPSKPISAIYFDGEKQKHYVKRFLIENENREEIFISNHSSSILEIISTDWRPVAQISFAKERNKERRKDLKIDIESFINVKGVNALGNQLAKHKINQIDLLDSLPFNVPEKKPADEIEVIEEEIVNESKPTESRSEVEQISKPNQNDNEDTQSRLSDSRTDINDEGQITLF